MDVRYLWQVVGSRAVCTQGREGAGVSQVVDMSIDGKDECREWGYWVDEAFRNLWRNPSEIINQNKAINMPKRHAIC